jgi:trk system potassium uptake protein TrkA
LLRTPSRRLALVVVVGCGRLGSILADTLSGQGASVVVVDQSEAAMARLSGAFSGFRILGDASEVSVLREAGVDRADFVIAATDRDNLNLFVALAAKELFGRSRVAARLFDPTREPVLDELDIVTLSPTMLGAEAFLAFLNGVDL